MWFAAHNYNIDNVFIRYVIYPYSHTDNEKLFEAGVFPSTAVHVSTAICQSQGELINRITILEELWQRNDRPNADVLTKWSSGYIIKSDVLRWLLKKGYNIPKKINKELCCTFDTIVIAIEYGCYYNNNVWPRKLSAVEEAWLTTNSYKLYGARLIRGHEDQYRR